MKTQIEIRPVEQGLSIRLHTPLLELQPRFAARIGARNDCMTVHSLSAGGRKNCAEQRRPWAGTQTGRSACTVQAGQPARISRTDQFSRSAGADRISESRPQPGSNDCVLATRLPRSRRFPTLPAFIITFTMQGGIEAVLSGTRPGRVLLHALCLLRHPGRLRWHWRGIVREFACQSMVLVKSS